MRFLLVTTQLAGISLLTGTMILLFFRRIYLDLETKKPIKFSLPLLGEVSTQAPVLALVLIATLMVVYPLSKMSADVGFIEGELNTGGKPVSVLVVAVPHYQYNQDSAGFFSHQIPLLATDVAYRVKFLVDKHVIADQQLKLEGGRFKFNPVTWIPAAEESSTSQINVRKEVSDEEIAKLLTTR
jgi:hypothetical protein